MWEETNQVSRNVQEKPFDWTFMVAFFGLKVVKSAHNRVVCVQGGNRNRKDPFCFFDRICGVRKSNFKPGRQQMIWMCLPVVFSSHHVPVYSAVTAYLVSLSSIWHRIPWLEGRFSFILLFPGNSTKLDYFHLLTQGQACKLCLSTMSTYSATNAHK